MNKKISPEKLEIQIVNNIKSFISFLESKNLYYYIGQTNEPDRRLKEHNKTKNFKEMFVLVKHSKETIDYLEHYIISLYFDNKYCLNTQNYSKIKKNDICFKPYKSNDFFVYVSIKQEIDLNEIQDITFINIFSIINKNNNISVISLLDKNISIEKSISSSSSTSSNSSSIKSSDYENDDIIINKDTILQTKTPSLSSSSDEEEIIQEDIKPTKQSKNSKETKKPTETKETKEIKNIKETKNTKETRKSKEIKENKKDKNKKEKEIKKIDIDMEKINNTIKNLIQTINKNIIRKEGVKPFTKLRIDLCNDYKYTMHKICYKKKIDDDNIKQLYKSSNDLELSYIFYELKKYYHSQKEINIKLDNFFCFLSTIHSCKDNNIIYFYLY